MLQNKNVSISAVLVSFLILFNAIFLKSAYTENEVYYRVLLISVPLLIIAIWDHFKSR